MFLERRRKFLLLSRNILLALRFSFRQFLSCKYTQTILSALKYAFWRATDKHKIRITTAYLENQLVPILKGHYWLQCFNLFWLYSLSSTFHTLWFLHGEHCRYNSVWSFPSTSYSLHSTLYAVQCTL